MALVIKKNFSKTDLETCLALFNEYVIHNNNDDTERIVSNLLDEIYTSGILVEVSNKWYEVILEERIWGDFYFYLGLLTDQNLVTDKECIGQKEINKFKNILKKNTV